MPGFMEAVEDIRSAEASVRNLFGGDTRVRDRRRSTEYMQQLGEAATFIAEVTEGRRPTHHLQEAMSTSDFPILMADVLDRQMLARYREIDPVWQRFIQRSTVPDFRPVARNAVNGAEGRLDEVGELEEYPEAAISEVEDTYRVKKYGRRLDLSWEAQINDDLDAFRNLPDRLARAARRTENWLATELYADVNGPHASLFDASNTIPGNPELSFASLQTAWRTFADAQDDDGEPILLEGAVLVIPPSLEVAAANILNATEVEVSTDDGLFRTGNWMAQRLTPVVDPYLPLVATDSPGDPWFVFAAPAGGRSALELGFLRGNEDPALYERAPDARRVGGGDVPESFHDDSLAWRVRHVVGGGQLVNTGGKKAVVASDGSGVS